MQSNNHVKGLAVCSEEKNIRNRSLKLYTYLLCHSNLVDNPGYGDKRRVFQQKDINLSKMGAILKMDERTIKKYWEQLESDGIIRFNDVGSNWKEDFNLSFNERWKIRRQHKYTYYHIIFNNNELFRKIPKETLIYLNENEYNKVDELTLKIYITLINFQEYAIMNNKTERIFTYQDLQEVLGFAQQSQTNRRMEKSLIDLRKLGLLEFTTGEKTTENGWKIPIFILKQVNWYVYYDCKDYDTSERTWDDETIQIVKEENQKYIK